MFADSNPVQVSVVRLVDHAARRVESEDVVTHRAGIKKTDLGVIHAPTCRIQIRSRLVRTYLNANIYDLD